MVIAKDSKSMALARAIHRSCQPTNRPTANRLPAHVASQPTHGIIEAGKNQLSLATYVLKCTKSPHSTPSVPAGPHNPKRSATAERNAAARATRSSKTAIPTSLFFMVSFTPVLLTFRDFYAPLLNEMCCSGHGIGVDLDSGNEVCVSPAMNLCRRATEFDLHAALHQVCNEL